MVRHLVAGLLLTSAIALGAGCFETGPIFYPDGAECPAATDPVCSGDCTAADLVDPFQCDGQVCLLLQDNKQGVIGVCSTSCFVDEDCNPHGRCIQIPEGAFCLRACATDDDCYDATVCRAVAGTGTSFCLADLI
ncbi:MAG: hypothetical protein R3B70_14365 [Polyangiaceae bacterium]